MVAAIQAIRSERPAGQARQPLAAILAGGQSRRFGTPKPFADLRGLPLLGWVRDAVARAIPEPVLIANDPEPFLGFGMRIRPDSVAGAGPLGGIHAALRWAEEETRPGALCVACDTPFLQPGLLKALVDRFARASAGMVAAQSRGPLGVEPLCAVYSVAGLAEIRRRLDSGEHALGALVQALGAESLPLDEVRRFGDPEVMFLNVNTRQQYEIALRIAPQAPAG